MGVTKIMIIRHAEKPGIYPPSPVPYGGINALGMADDDSLVTFGWERAGGIANLFFPTDKRFQNSALVTPDYIYAADPAFKKDKQGTGEKEPSQRPYQTVTALVAKMRIPVANFNASFDKKDFKQMVSDVLALPSGTVLISWQHQLILPKSTGDDCIVTELMAQTIPATHLDVPKNPWPQNRYDMVFVFDRPSGTGPFTSFTQVPQMLLAGDVTTPFT